jgi:hypothetical protein
LIVTAMAFEGAGENLFALLAAWRPASSSS